MKHHDCDGFWEGGADAWWRGLYDAIKTAKERLTSATSDEERADAQTRLDELKRQEADAERNGDRWLH